MHRSFLQWRRRYSSHWKFGVFIAMISLLLGVVHIGTWFQGPPPFMACGASDEVSSMQIDLY